MYASRMQTGFSACKYLLKTNWKPINALATRLGRKMGTAQGICTQVGPKHRELCMGNGNVTLINRKE